MRFRDGFQFYFFSILLLGFGCGQFALDEGNLNAVDVGNKDGKFFNYSWKFENAADYQTSSPAIVVDQGTAHSSFTEIQDRNGSLEGFGGGSFLNMEYDTSSQLLQLDSVGMKKKRGEFTSRVFDASTPVLWNHLSWVPLSPYGKELPNDRQSETLYTKGNIDMSENIVLYHFNEPTWQTQPSQVRDASGNGYHAKIHGTLQNRENGKFNRAVFSKGKGNYVVSQEIKNALNGLQELSLSIWVRSRHTQSNQGIISTNTPNQSDRGISLRYHQHPSRPNSIKGTLSILKSNSQIKKISVWSANQKQVKNKWQHIALSWKSGEFLNLYIDGKKTTASGQSGKTQGSLTQIDKLLIGIGSQGGSQSSWNGFWDEAAIWGKAMTDEEINNLYLRGLARVMFQVRSCQNSDCSDGTFSGPYENENNWYSEMLNLRTPLPSLSIPLPSEGRYWQYRIRVRTDEKNIQPQLSAVSASYTLASSQSMWVRTLVGPEFKEIKLFLDETVTPQGTSIRYQISNDGNTWYLHDGVIWTEATKINHPHIGNTAQEVNEHIHKFDDDVGEGTLYVRSFFIFDQHPQKIELDGIEVVGVK